MYVSGTTSIYLVQRTIQYIYSKFTSRFDYALALSCMIQLAW